MAANPGRLTGDARVRAIIAAHPGLQEALCALSAFRHRHDRYHNPRRRGVLVRRHRGHICNSQDAATVAWCRLLIADARRAGFRGSIRSLFLPAQEK